MRHYFLSFVSMLILVLVNPSISFAQTGSFDADKAYQDYLYNYNLYRDSHLRYVSARSEYFSYRTLNAETKALESTRDMLSKRAEVLRTYLVALRMLLIESTGITNYQQNMAFVKLDTETTWLKEHKDSLSAPDSLQDLVKVSEPFESKFPDTEILSYQTLGLILSGRINQLQDKVSNQINLVDQKLNAMKEAGENVDKLDRWLIEARKKMALSEQKQKEAEDILKEMKSAYGSKRDTFVKGQLTYGESNQYLKEAVSFLTEIINDIKYE